MILRGALLFASLFTFAMVWNAFGSLDQHSGIPETTAVASAVGAVVCSVLSFLRIRQLSPLATIKDISQRWPNALRVAVAVLPLLLLPQFASRTTPKLDFASLPSGEAAHRMSWYERDGRYFMVLNQRSANKAIKELTKVAYDDLEWRFSEQFTAFLILAHLMACVAWAVLLWPSRQRADSNNIESDAVTSRTAS